ARYASGLAEAEGRDLSLHLVTNGVLLTPETIFRLDDLGFSLTVSLDGPPAYHNKIRPSADGTSSFRATARALHLMTGLPIGQRVTVRGTFTRRSAEFAPFAKFLLRMGFSRNLAYEPVFLPSGNPLAIRWSDLPSIKASYVELAHSYADAWKRGEPFCLWDFDDALIQLALGCPRQSRCGAGVTGLALTAGGDVYACHMSTGMRDAWLGNLEAGLAEERRRPWHERYLRGRGGCSNCWLEKLCGGGCSAHSLLYNNAFALPYRLECSLIEHRYRLAFWILSEVEGLREMVQHCYSKMSQARNSGHFTVPLWFHADQMYCPGHLAGA
ncbi:MAG: SPASM domain-containing protein, partial [Syntrophobacteraceae bacterium]